MAQPYSILGREIDLEVLTNYYLLGATEKEIAFFLGVSEAELKKTIDNDPILRQAMLNGSVLADGAVARSLFICAVGYRGKTTKAMNTADGIRVIEYDQYYAPNVQAQVAWLTQRRWLRASTSEETAHQDVETLRNELHERYSAAIRSRRASDKFLVVNANPDTT
jgi:hypothetical protein